MLSGEGGVHEHVRVGGLDPCAQHTENLGRGIARQTALWETGLAAECAALSASASPKHAGVCNGGALCGGGDRQSP